MDLLDLNKSVTATIVAMSIWGCNETSSPSESTLDPAPNISYPDSLVAFEQLPLDTVRPQTTGVISGFSVIPPLPAGLVMDAATGAIAGTPLTGGSPQLYTIIAQGPGGADTSLLSIRIQADTMSWIIRATGDSINAVIWAGDQFVAVGNAGKILTSANGEAWTVRASGTHAKLNGIGWSGSQFVAVGGVRFYESSDLVTWTAREHTGGLSMNAFNDWRAALWTGSDWLVVGHSYGLSGTDRGTMARSPDGATWISERLSKNYTFRSIARNENKLLAITEWVFRYWNGENWTDISMALGPTNPQFMQAIFANGTWMAVGQHIATSTDAVAWQRIGLPQEAAALQAVVWTGEKYIAVGKAGTIVTSRDGVNWNKQQSPFTTTLRAIAWGNGQLVVAGDGVIATSR